MPDYATPYREIRQRVTTLVRAHEPHVDTVAPATPEWRVRDLLSHLVGICDDIMSGNLEGIATDEWTAAQVRKRHDWPVEQILEEWTERGPVIEEQMAAMPVSQFGQMVYDAVTHEHDIRGALRQAGARDSSAVAVAFDWATDAGYGEMLAGDGSFTFATDSGRKTYGSGEPATTLHESRFEIIRAASGRRSIGQMRAYRWEGEPKAEQLVAGPLFHPPDEDLIE